MKIYDISQEVFSCEVYSGDSEPIKSTVKSIKCGDSYNLTGFSMCAHNGTHIDAPFHFIENGSTVDLIPLEKMIGLCYVAEFNGTMNSSDAYEIVERAKSADPEAAKRILIKGNANVTASASGMFAAADILLLGTEAQSIGEPESPQQAHMLLLEKEIVILEGIRIRGIDDGIYFLSAAPLSLGGADGAPCRAVLIDF